MSDIKYAYPLIQNKVEPPHYVTPLLRRPRLLDWLHAGSNCRAMVIAADAGYGKTTLLWQWEREVDFPCYWFKLDRNDRDWTLHISYLIEAISKRHPGFGHRAHSMLQQLGGPGSSRPGVAAYLLSEMHDTLTEPCTFIIDDWQYVASVTEVRGLWNQILRDAPPTCRFVFASRAKPQLQFARFKTHSGYQELRTNALRFTDIEIDDLFRDVYHDPLDPTELVELERRTEGWAASLQLVEVSLRERKTPEARREFIQSITATSDSDLFEFLAEEVLDQQTEQTRNFLLCTSILQRINPELAERLAGVQDGARQLADLEQRGLFTYRLGPDDGRYRYHNLFREFLERRLISERPESEVTGLHIHAASYFETHEEWPQAIHHYLRAGLQPQAARLIAKYGEDVASEGRLGLVDEWLQQLPAKTIHDNARLSLLHGEALGMRGEFDGSLAALARARSFFARKGDRRMEALACLKQSSVYHNQGDVASSAEMAAEGMALVPADARALRLRLDGNVAITTTWLQEGLAAVARVCMRIAAEATTAGWEHFAAIAFHNLGVAYRLMGQLPESLMNLDRASRFWSDLPASPFADNSELTMALLMSGDMKRAEHAALSGCNSTQAWPRPHAEAQIALAAVRVQQGRFPEAVSLLGSLLNHTDQLGALRTDASALLIEALYLSQANSEAMLQALDATQDMPRDPRLAPLIDPTESVARHSLGKCKGGCQETAAMLKEWDSKGAHTPALIGMVKLNALAVEHRGSRAVDTAVSWLGRAVEAGLVMHLRYWIRQYGHHASLLANSEEGLRLLLVFLEADPEYWRSPLTSLLPTMDGDARQRLLAAVVKVANKATAVALAGISGQDVAAARRHLTRLQAARIYIRAFGSLAIQRGDRRGPSINVDKRRLRALLGLLVVHSRQVLSRDMALDILWPDADPAAALNNLNQSVFQLRRILNPGHRDGESPQYLLSSPGSIQLDPDLVKTDLDDFRSMSAKLVSTPSGKERRRIAHSLITLIGGEFLADLKYEEWMPRIETAVHAEVRQTLLPLARGECDSPDLSVRAACALTLLDEFDEGATLAMAHQLATTGKRTAAREVVTRFAAKLRNELDEPPSVELRAALNGYAQREPYITT